jgi:putative flippase GtrA
VRLSLSPQFGRLLLVGGVAAAVNVASRIVYGTCVDHSASIILAYLTGMVTAFVMARRFVFPLGKSCMHRSAAIFSLVNAVALLRTSGVNILLTDHVVPCLGIRRHTETMAHLIRVGVPAVTCNIGQREWTFR